MPDQSLTLNVPEPLHRWLEERAAKAHRSMEGETLDLLSAAAPGLEPLPRESAEAVSPLRLLDDSALWRAARSRLGDDAAQQLEELHLKRQREGLTADDEQSAALVRQCERAMLVRAEAAAELHRRGHDVSGLVAP